MENMHEGTLNVAGKILETRCVAQDIYSFGPIHAEAVHLENWWKVNGFFNAVADVMDGAYKLLKVGFHSKVAWEMLPTKFDKEENVAYVNFDMLINVSDTETLSRLKRQGIVPQEGKYGWLILGVQNGHYFCQGYAAPKSGDEIMGIVRDDDGNVISQARKREEVPPFEWKRNEDAWTIINKHNGVHFVMMILAGHIKVICNYETKAGFEWREKDTWIKYQNLYKSAETRKEKTMAVIERRFAQEGLKNSTWYQEHDVERQAEARIAVEHGIDILNAAGQPVCVAATDLVKARIVYITSNGTERRGGVYLGSLEQVANATVFAKSNNMTIKVAPLA